MEEICHYTHHARMGWEANFPPVMVTMDEGHALSPLSLALGRVVLSGGSWWC